MNAPTIEVASTEKFLRLRDVLSRTGLSRSMAYSLTKEGAFPRPINLGARAVAWLESEVTAWIKGRVRASREQASGTRS